MSRLELIDGENWRDFIAAPVAVLMLARGNCNACASWTEELTAELEDPARGEGIRFGKMLLDGKGLIDFKRESLWLASVDALPTSVIYVNGERKIIMAGGDWAELENRLKQYQ